jgi:hypothetical protein
LLRDLEVTAMVENRLSAAGIEDRSTVAADGRGDRAILPGENHTAKDKPSPLPNGANGRPAPLSSGDGPVTGASKPATETHATGAARGPDGRFAKGNPGGPGNPFARQVAALRQAALAAITPADVRAIIAKMGELALVGDVQAAKLVLAYAIGKPAGAADPDRLDLQEWNHFKEAAPMLNEVESLLTPEPAVLLPSVRWGGQARTWEFADGLTAALRAPGPASPPPGRVGRGPKVGQPTDDAQRGPPNR